MKKQNASRIAAFLYEVGTLRKISRSHKQTLIIADDADNIASHSFRVAHIGWFLAQSEKVDPYKVLLMCLYHDVPETRSGDQNWVHKKYVKVFEQEIIHDQLTDLPHTDELLTTIKEYTDRKSKESLVAKDADLIDQILLLKEYVMAGNMEAQRWLGRKEYKGKNHIARLSTPTAKKLAQEIISQEPSDWWQTIWTSENRK